jgi:hypothetical protein
MRVNEGFLDSARPNVAGAQLIPNIRAVGNPCDQNLSLDATLTDV